MLGRGKPFADVIERQLDLFVADESDLLDEAAEAYTAASTASREDSEERYGDYQLVVDAIADRLSAIRDGYASSLEGRSHDEYRRAFDHAATRRLGRYASALAETS